MINMEKTLRANPDKVAVSLPDIFWIRQTASLKFFDYKQTYFTWRFLKNYRIGQAEDSESFFPALRQSSSQPRFRNAKDVYIPNDARSEDMMRINDRLHEEVDMLINTLESQIEKAKAVSPLNYSIP